MATPQTKSEIKFLEGPQSGRVELWFILKVVVSLVVEFRALHYAAPCVTFFWIGSFPGIIGRVFPADGFSDGCHVFFQPDICHAP